MCHNMNKSFVKSNSYEISHHVRSHSVRLLTYRHWSLNWRHILYIYLRNRHWSQNWHHISYIYLRNHHWSCGWLTDGCLYALYKITRLCHKWQLPETTNRASWPARAVYEPLFATHRKMPFSYSYVLLLWSRWVSVGECFWNAEYNELDGSGCSRHSATECEFWIRTCATPIESSAFVM
jgi:hypothetical protein